MAKKVLTDLEVEGSIGINATPSSAYKVHASGNGRIDGVCDVALTANTNLRVNGATHAGETWDGAILMKKTGTTPGDEVADEVALWAEEISGVTELRVMNSNRDRSTLSSHIDGKWCYKSDNTKTGKSVVIHMEDLVKAVEEHLGVSFSEIVEGSE